MLCGSEMSAYRGAGMAAGNNGHEAAGIVAELGADAILAEIRDASVDGLLET